VIIDAHIHYRGDHPDAVALLAAGDIRMLNVAVAVGPGDLWREQAEVYRDLASHHPAQYAWCTTFDPPGETVWASSEAADAYADTAIAGLSMDFERGAVGCKVWKGIGMRLRKPSGMFVMADDAVFDPIYEYLAASEKTLLMHIGEPLACWQPLDGTNAHAGYYREHPDWYMGNKPDHPSHDILIEARDRVVSRHPTLRVVGAHLGSLEYNVSEVAARLERYPNFAVDTSARMLDLLRQDQGRVRDFFIRFADRILYGTDLVQTRPISLAGEAERNEHLAWLRDRYVRESAYLEGCDPVTLYGVEARGLGLPRDVVDAVLAGNAQRWYPGL
jgi:predicted TIM-barrel fold metal-dependent hydrolase